MKRPTRFVMTFEFDYSPDSLWGWFDLLGDNRRRSRSHIEKAFKELMQEDIQTVIEESKIEIVWEEEHP